METDSPRLVIELARQEPKDEKENQTEGKTQREEQKPGSQKNRKAEQGQGDEEKTTRKNKSGSQGQEDEMVTETQKEERKDGQTEAILNHLLFHKSIIDEERSAERINHYMGMVEDLSEGVHITIKNPFEKSIAIAFELVMEQHLDPWDLDLIEFSKMYLRKVKDQREIDFVTAGKLIFMAWSILKMQSAAILASAEPQQPQQDMESWSPADLDLYRSPEEFDYTTTVMNSSEPPLQEMVWRESSRPVTLIELVEAFEEARKDAELRMKLAEQRRNRYKVDMDFGSKVHREDLGEDICLTWKRILAHDGRPIPFSQISNGCREDIVTVLMSILFLAQMEKVKIWQKKMPEGEIYIQNLIGHHEELDINIKLPEFKEDEETDKEEGAA